MTLLSAKYFEEIFTTLLHLGGFSGIPLDVGALLDAHTISQSWRTATPTLRNDFYAPVYGGMRQNCPIYGAQVSFPVIKLAETKV